MVSSTKNAYIVAFLLFLPIVLAETVSVSVNVLERPLPTGYVVLVRGISPFVIGAGVIMFILSTVFDLSNDIKKIVFSFLAIVVLIVMVSLLLTNL